MNLRRASDVSIYNPSLKQKPRCIMNVTLEKDFDFSDYELNTKSAPNDKFAISKDSFKLGDEDNHSSSKKPLEAEGIDIFINSTPPPRINRENQSSAPTFKFTKVDTDDDFDKASIRSAGTAKNGGGSLHSLNAYQAPAYHGGSPTHSLNDHSPRHHHSYDHRDARDDEPHYGHRRDYERDYDARSDAGSIRHESFTPEEIERQKRAILYELERLEKRGVFLNKKFTMNSSLEEMKYEYEKLKNQKDIDSAIKFYRNTLLTFVTGAEYLNDNYSPYKFRLEGWSEGVIDNLDNYDDVFEELHLKYKNKVKLPPELKLVGMVVGSGFLTHLTNSIVKTSSIPNMSDILRNNPDLARQFQAAAVNTTAQQNPGMDSIFNMMNSMGANIPSAPMPTPPAPQPVQRNEMRGPNPDILNSLGVNFARAQPQTPIQPQTPMPRPPIRPDADVRSVTLTELNEDDRISEISSLNESDLKDLDLGTLGRSVLARPSISLRPTGRDGMTSKPRRKRAAAKPTGLVINV